MRLRHSRGGVIHEVASFTNRRNRSDVALENARLGQSGQALANRSRTTLTNALDGHQVLNVGGKEFLEVLEVVDESLDDRSRQAGHLRQESVAPGADCCIEGIAADSESDGLGTRGQVEQLDGRELHQVGQDLLDLAAGAKAVGFAVGGDALDAAVSPRGYRLLTKVPRLPGAIVERLVDHFENLQKLLSANLEDLMAVEGVGEGRARAVREGLSRLAESSILERYV